MARRRPKFRRLNPDPTGHCYSDAFRMAKDYALEREEKFYSNNVLLIHGIVCPDPHKPCRNRIDHAWVEVEDLDIVLEPQHDVVWERGEFYEAYDAVPRQKYTVRDAMRNMIAHNHMGPWEE